MSIRVCDNCGIKNTDYPVYDIENQRNLYFCSRECFEKYINTQKILKNETPENELLKKHLEETERFAEFLRKTNMSLKVE